MEIHGPGGKCTIFEWGRQRLNIVYHMKILVIDDERSIRNSLKEILMDEGYDHAVKAVGMILSGRIGDAMSEYNRKKKEEPRS